MMGKNVYRAMLRRRAAEAREAREESAPISLTEHKARRDMERWRTRFAAYMAGMQSLAGSPGDADLSPRQRPGGSADTTGGC